LPARRAGATRVASHRIRDRPAAPARFATGRGDTL